MIGAMPIRITHVVIENFRCFRGRKEISLCAGQHADQVVVFHGLNGSGKSTALEAIDLFFRTGKTHLEWRREGGDPEMARNWNDEPSPNGLSLSYLLDWPPDVRDPMQIQLWFEGAVSGGIRVRFVPAGDKFFIYMEKHESDSKTPPEVNPENAPWSEVPKDEVLDLLNKMVTPSGPGSSPFFLLDAHRRGSWLYDSAVQEIEPQVSTMPLDIVKRLHELKSSLDPKEKGRWRAFTKLVERFSLFADKGIEIETTSRQGKLEVRLEDPERLILPISRLSSGEQQLITLCAALLTSRASIVAIEEPEMSLHPDNQSLLHEILREQVQEGVIDQVFLESHATAFDGREVIRFERSPDGVCSTRRAPARQEELGGNIRESAIQKGAEERYVTREGYTQLPEIMIRDLGFDHDGGKLWFARAQSRWEAWPEHELAEYLGAVDEESEDEQ